MATIISCPMASNSLKCKPFPIVQVSQNGLDIIGFLIDRLASDFKPYLNTVLTSIVDRFLLISKEVEHFQFDNKLMITLQAGRHEREREGEGKHRLVQAHGRHSHPSATLREADTAFLA